MDLWARKCVPYYVSLTTRVRTCIESLLFKEINRESVVQMVVGSGIFAPIQEELERTLVMCLVKNALQTQNLKAQKLQLFLFQLSSLRLAITRTQSAKNFNKWTSTKTCLMSAYSINCG